MLAAAVLSAFAPGTAAAQAPAADGPAAEADEGPGEAATVEAPGDQPEAAADASSAGVAGAAPIAADPQVLEEARAHFKQGVAFADAGNCNGAIGEFLAAYQLIPRANALYNVAQCQERLFRYDLAIQYYKRYLDEAEADAPDRTAVEAALRTLGNLLATLHVHSNVKAEVWVDDRMAGEAPGDVLVPAGGHSVELRAEGFIPARTEVRVVGREEVGVELKLVKARTTVRVTETTGLHPALFWSGAAATLISASIGTYFAVRVGQLHSEGLDLPARHPDRQQYQDDTESAQLTADIFFGTAAVLGVATTVVAFVTEWDDEAPPKPGDEGDGEAETRLRWVPLAGAGRAGLLLEGRL